MFSFLIFRAKSAGIVRHAGKHHAQTHVALLKIGYGSHHLLIGSVIADLLQLAGQICQFLCMGGIVACHVFHQRHQLFHGRVLAGSSAALADAGASLLMIVVMVVMFMVMIVMMLMLMIVMVVMVMIVVVMVMTGQMIVMDMHR